MVKLFSLLSLFKVFLITTITTTTMISFISTQIKIKILSAKVKYKATVIILIKLLQFKQIILNGQLITFSSYRLLSNQKEGFIIYRMRRKFDNAFISLIPLNSELKNNTFIRVNMQFLCVDLPPFSTMLQKMGLGDALLTSSDTQFCWSRNFTVL